jgi:hypothetical protein
MGNPTDTSNKPDAAAASEPQQSRGFLGKVADGIGKGAEVAGKVGWGIGKGLFKLTLGLCALALHFANSWLGVLIGVMFGDKDLREGKGNKDIAEFAKDMWNSSEVGSVIKVGVSLLTDPKPAPKEKKAEEKKPEEKKPDPTTTSTSNAQSPEVKTPTPPPVTPALPAAAATTTPTPEAGTPPKAGLVMRPEVEKEVKGLAADVAAAGATPAPAAENPKIPTSPIKVLRERDG